MYEYKCVKLGLKRLGIKAMVLLEVEDHSEIIDKHAKEGWRLVQIFPVKYAGSDPTEFEIIFERKVDK